MIGDSFDSVLTAAQEGAEWALSVLYRELNPRLLRYFAAREPGIAEDLASETWLAVARQLHGFEGDETGFRAWLFTIGRRRLIQHWRDQGRRPSTPVAPETLPEHAAADDTEATALERGSAIAAARRIAEALTPDQADVVLLRVLAGLGVSEVAEVLGKRPGTVRVLQHKALRHLATSFAPEVLTR